MVRVLILDRDQILTEMLNSYLSDYFEVSVATSLSSASSHFKSSPDVVIVSESLDMDPILSHIRENQSLKQIGVILLFERLGADKLERTFELGADLALEKPLKLDLLRWNIMWLSQRSRGFESQSPRVLKWEDSELNVRSHELTHNRITYVLTPIQAQLLKLFFNNPETMLTREFLKRSIWPNEKISHRSIDAHISKLKSATQAFSVHISSVYGKGYVLTSQARSKAI